ncbi:MAG: N-acetylneuraminate synthase family protein [Anaerolineae bacterium]|nr:N-acetylneuraminate synthase family protein [Anaerolineae bacterium]
MSRQSLVRVGTRQVGNGQPVFIIAEIGINHNGSLDMARKLIDAALFAGCDAVKFQKRTVELCVPEEQRSVLRDTPWGRMTYIDYRYRLELGREEYSVIDRYCRERGILWFASCWDEPSVAFIEQFEPPLLKAASASLTDIDLLRAMRRTGLPLMLSTGMSELPDIDAAVATAGEQDLLLAHSTSAYPCPPEALNLRMILRLQERFGGVPIGYSGHEVGLAPTWAAVSMGACFVERHITLDRAMWGTDQAASVEVMGMHQLVRNIRDIERAMGDGIKRIYASELPALKKLRRVPGFNGTQPVAA